MAVLGGGVAGSPDTGDGLTTLNLLASYNQQFRVMGVQRAQSVAVVQDDGPSVVAHGGAVKHTAGAYGQYLLVPPAADIQAAVAVAAAPFPEVGEDLAPCNGPGPAWGSNSRDENPLVDQQSVGVAEVVDPDQLLDGHAVVSGDPVQGLPGLDDVNEAGTLHLLVCGARLRPAGLNRRADIGRLRTTATDQAQGQGQSGKPEDGAVTRKGFNDSHSKDQDIKGRCVLVFLDKSTVEAKGFIFKNLKSA